MFQGSRHLFASSRNVRGSISKNRLLFFIEHLIAKFGALGVARGLTPRALSVRAVASSVAVRKNLPVAKMLETGTWRFCLVFSSFYLRDVANSLGDLSSLCHLVSAGQVIRT